jgi:uncharacterized lipoprotein NlpE involved in copper resistance
MPLRNRRIPLVVSVMMNYVSDYREFMWNAEGNNEVALVSVPANST